MLKKLFALLLIFAVLVSCGKKKEAPKEPVQEQSAPMEIRLIEMPSFSKMFAVLDNLKTEDFDQALKQEDLDPGKDFFISAFALGRLSADAVIATKSRNKSKLEEYAKQMIDYSNLLSIGEDILKLSDDLITLLKEDKWVELEKTLDKYKTDVEINLHEMQDYDLVTLLQLGGWTEGLNRVTFLLMNNYDQEKTKIINQLGIVNNLIDSMSNMYDPSTQEEPVIQIGLKNFQKIKEILVKSQTYTKPQIEEIFKLTEEIKQTVQ